MRQEVLRKLRETEETKRREEEAVRKADADRVAAEIARREAIVRGERDQWDNRRNKRTKRRKQGYRIAGIGIGCASVAAVFAALGANTNSAIEGGGFASAADISSKVTQGKVFNDLALGFGIAGGVGVAVGTTLVVLHWDIGSFKIGASASGEVKAIVLTGSLP